LEQINISTFILLIRNKVVPLHQITKKRKEMETTKNKIETIEQKVAIKVSKTLEAARRLKGSIIVNDPVLYIH